MDSRKRIRALASIAIAALAGCVEAHAQGRPAPRDAALFRDEVTVARDAAIDNVVGRVDATTHGAPSDSPRADGSASRGAPFPRDASTRGYDSALADVIDDRHRTPLTFEPAPPQARPGVLGRDRAVDPTVRGDDAGTAPLGVGP